METNIAFRSIVASAGSPRPLFLFSVQGDLYIEWVFGQGGTWGAGVVLFSV